jgi:hypothetical protein
MNQVIHRKPCVSGRRALTGGHTRGDILNENLAPMKIPMLCEKQAQHQPKQRATEGVHLEGHEIFRRRKSADNLPEEATSLSPAHLGRLAERVCFQIRATIG